ncbi:MAG: FtsW/RodA/SpoVE family cell cycle protein, partial [Rubrobacter sp.]|nr:FtsW/RodA/SpoVE family cell cycle protein [Rubrobacter sp.]
MRQPCVISKTRSRHGDQTVIQRATVPMTIALLVTTLGFAILISVQEVKSPPLIYGGLYAGVMVALYFVVRIWLLHSDAILLLIVTLLTGVGLLMIYRLTYGAYVAEILAIAQATWILIGSSVFVFVALFFRNYQKLFTYKYLLALGALALIGATFTPLGYEVNGARLWVQTGPASVQPSEFARILLIVFFASYLAEKRDLLTATSRSFVGVQLPALKYFGLVALVLAFSLGFLIFEKDLGISLLFFTAPLLMLYVAIGRMAYIILGALLFVVGALATYQLFSHVQVRVASWFDPYGEGFQIIQSIFNIADGALTGTGLDRGFSQSITNVQT